MSLVTVVVTYNASLWVEKCFGSLVNADIPDHYIIAVDNGSSDATCQILQTQFPAVELIRNTSNMGFGKANNIGLKKALDLNADCLLLNQDAWFATGELEKLVSKVDMLKSFTLLSPLHKNVSGDLDQNFQSYLKPKLTPHIISDALTNTLKEVYETSYVNAACWYIKYDTLKKVGGFNPLFFMYGEDDDYLNRLRYHHLQIGILPDVAVTHDRKVISYLNKTNAQLRMFYKHKYLAILSNPQLITVKALLRLFQNLYRDSKILLIKKRMFGIPLISFFKTILKLHLVIKYRKLSKHTGPAFL